jgi:hypothetical protein
MNYVSAEFENMDALGYHQIAFLESHLQGEISGFFELPLFYPDEVISRPLSEYREFLTPIRDGEYPIIIKGCIKSHLNERDRGVGRKRKFLFPIFCDRMGAEFPSELAAYF